MSECRYTITQTQTVRKPDGRISRLVDTVEMTEAEFYAACERAAAESKSWPAFVRAQMGLKP